MRQPDLPLSLDWVVGEYETTLCGDKVAEEEASYDPSPRDERRNCENTSIQKQNRQLRERDACIVDTVVRESQLDGISVNVPNRDS